MGALAIAGWLYAVRDRRLVIEEAADRDLRQITASLLTEPITAVLTIGVAFLGSGWWTLSWLVFGAVVGRLVKRWEALGRPEEAADENA